MTNNLNKKVKLKSKKHFLKRIKSNGQEGVPMKNLTRNDKDLPLSVNKN